MFDFTKNKLQPPSANISPETYVSVPLFNSKRKFSMPNEWISVNIHNNAQICEKHKLKFRNEKAFSHATHTSNILMLADEDIYDENFYYNIFISLSDFASVLFGTAYDSVHRSVFVRVHCTV